MNKLKPILAVIVILIVLGLLSFGGYMLWNLNEQSKLLQKQSIEQQAELKQIQSNFEKIGNQINEINDSGAKQSTEIKTSLTSIGKQTQEQGIEQSKALTLISSTTESLGQNIKQNQGNLGQIIQNLSEHKNVLSDTRIDICGRIADVKKWVEALAKTEADKYFMAGVQQWDEGDLNGAIEYFKQTVLLNNEFSGAYYNIALAYRGLGQTNQACDYAYQAGCSYLQQKNINKANRMIELLNTLDSKSDYINKIRNEMATNTPSKSP
ncbi:MAG: hypothetical protein KKG09_10540 [Verrucomicrobia bacterium]|nr:hypothetical protein [Verrucomicrobiota bacterium]MCG2681968.1 hypothetical protein [Kiritimatiellia bacterium]MBU4248444.1 hypothetical protein [Verrucomicrobiota bacterium]MBU4292346.1 hypothetical protein [Verrucomicrobiota bacterium]MBU4430025.1 hypothetical protein [Verrucomicrobiota bacterium]